MYVVTYLQTVTHRVENGVLFFNNADALNSYKKEMGMKPVTHTELTNLFEEYDGFRCIINKI